MGQFEAVVPGASVSSVWYRVFHELWALQYETISYIFVIKNVPIDTGPVLSGCCALGACNSPKHAPLNLLGGLELKRYVSREGYVLGCCERGDELSCFIKYGLFWTR